MFLLINIKHFYCFNMTREHFLNILIVFFNIFKLEADLIYFRFEFMEYFATLFKEITKNDYDLRERIQNLFTKFTLNPSELIFIDREQKEEFLAHGMTVDDVKTA